MPHVAPQADRTAAEPRCTFLRAANLSRSSPPSYTAGMTHVPHIQVLYSRGVVAMDPCRALGAGRIARLALSASPSPMREF